MADDQSTLFTYALLHEAHYSPYGVRGFLVLLRRISKHVKDQNWTAVALDFVIVVAGVYIGIQVANWNDGLAQNAQEADIVQGVAADLRIDLEELETGSKILIAGITAGNYTLAEIGEPPLSTDSFAGVPAFNPRELEPTEEDKTRLWSLLVAGYYPTPGTTAYDALMSTGKLGIISDPELVDAIQYYYAQRKGMDLSHNYTLRPLRDEMLKVGQRFGLSPFRDISEAQLFEKLAAHEELRTAFRNQLGYKVLQYNELSNVADAGKDILGRIEAYEGS